MPARPFGHVSRVVMQERRSKARTRAEHQALDAAERARQAAKWELEQFFKAQQKRFSCSLTRSVAKIQEARWGTADSDDVQLTATRR
jgi:hypothetical protein